MVKIKVLFFLLISFSFLKADFPTYGEIFTGKKNKKEKVKVIYVEKKIIGPSYEDRKYYNPLRKHRNENIDKNSILYPLNKNKKHIYKKKYGNADTNYIGVKGLREQAKDMDARRELDINKQRTRMRNQTRKINKKSLEKTIKNSQSMDAVDRLHMMAKCEAEAKTNEEKELCWRRKEVKKGRYNYKSSPTKKSIKKMGSKEEEEVLKIYNKMYKNNKYYKNSI